MVLQKLKIKQLNTNLINPVNSYRLLYQCHKHAKLLQLFAFYVKQAHTLKSKPREQISASKQVRMNKN